MPDLIEELFRRPVIPVLTVDGVEEAIATARALGEGGLDVIEVTLRTAVALEAIGAIRKALPELLVGAGTVVSPGDFERAERAGASFLVSPGTTARLLEAAGATRIPWLPAAASVSESLILLEHGFRFQKLFPAEPLGGVEYLGALRGPVAQAVFCPTGGVNARTAPSYLACPNVAAVGGSWVAPAPLVRGGDWAGIAELARTAGALPRAWGGK